MYNKNVVKNYLILKLGASTSKMTKISTDEYFCV